MKKIHQLNEIASITLGYPFRGRIDEAKEGIPVIQLKDTSIESGINYLQWTITEIPNNAEEYYLQNQDILFSPRGSSNHSVIFDQEETERRYLASPNFFVIRTHYKEALPQFIAWQLNQIVCQQYFERNAEGSTIKNIRRKTLEETPITLPSIEKQTTIIKLDEVQRKEQKLFNAFIEQNKAIMNAIAQQLIS